MTVEDKLFEDCCNIADKYETNLLTVLGEFTSIELTYKKEKHIVKYEKLINETEQYFKKRLEEQKNGTGKY